MSSTTKKGKQPAKSTSKKGGFTAEEKAAMRARARELKDKTDGETAVRRAIAAMAPKDRAIAKQVHELVKAAAPDLTPKTWYGMPAYAKDGKVVCFFRNAGKFKERYAMIGFNDTALRILDEDVDYLDALERGDEKPALPKDRDDREQRDIHARNLRVVG